MLVRRADSARGGVLQTVACFERVPSARTRFFVHSTSVKWLFSTPSCEELELLELQQWHLTMAGRSDEARGTVQRAEVGPDG